MLPFVFIAAGLAMLFPAIQRGGKPLLRIGGGNPTRRDEPARDVPVSVDIVDVPTIDGEIDRTTTGEVVTTGRPSLDPTEVDFLARTLWAEARGEPEAGIEAVAQVILNRVNSRRYPDTIEGVVTQPYQFSAWNRNDPNRKSLLALRDGDPEFERMKTIARRVIRGEVPARVTPSTLHYANPKTVAAYSGGIIPASHWINTAASSFAIGHHSFYDGVA